MNKKLYLIAAMLTVAFSTVFAQQVSRNFVVMEIATGTWCQACSIVADVADDLYENDCKLAIIENHDGDAFTNDASEARVNYYNISDFPTTMFDGTIEKVGSDSYQKFYEAYTEALSVMSDFTIDLSFTQSEGNLNVTVEIEEVEDYTGIDLVLHLVFTESHIPYSWMGFPELNFVNRAMYPDENGTALDFSGSSSITETFTITPDAEWDLLGGEIVAYIQDNTTKAILQTDKVITAESIGVNNVQIVKIISPNGTPCENTTTPKIQIRNLGSETITSLKIDYDVNSEVSGTINWTGSIEFTKFEIVELDEVTYTQLDANVFTITLSDPNGVDDDHLDDNEKDKTIYAPIKAIGPIYLELETGSAGNECLWNIKNSSGSVVAYGGPYENNITIEESFTLENDCHTFYIYDTGHNGGGEVTIKDSEGTQLFYTNGNYGSGTSNNFRYLKPSSASEVAPIANNFLIYPNPVSSKLTIVCNGNLIGNLNFYLYSITGLLVYEFNSKVDSELELYFSNIKSGIYFLNIKNSEISVTKKISVVNK